MHFIVGGAFQGKRKWVKQYYRINQGESFLWCNGYKSDPFFPYENIKEPVIIFEGLEMMIRRKLCDDLSSCRADWNQFFQAWCDWEKEDCKRRVVWIGCDITQGIVPMSQKERNWRDLTGWCYQDLVKLCDRVDRVWCGLVERKK